MFTEPDLLLLICFGALFFTMLFIMSLIDIKSYILPNSLTLPLIPIGILHGWIFTQNWTNYIIGAIAGYSIFVMVEHTFKALTGKAGLGRGDAKLLAVGGAWCGWISLPNIILVASCSGLIFALYRKFTHKTPDTHPQNMQDDMTAEWIPFGPFLAFSCFTIWCILQF